MSSRKLERGAIADLWRNTLSRIPTAFGRLFYLSSLRDPHSGMYQHQGLGEIFGSEEAGRALAESHIDTFSQWLNFSLEEQKKDLEEYLWSLPGDKRSILRAWIQLSPYGSLAPPGARDMERKLYTSDLEMVLEILRQEYGIATPDPDA